MLALANATDALLCNGLPAVSRASRRATCCTMCAVPVSCAGDLQAGLGDTITLLLVSRADCKKGARMGRLLGEKVDGSDAMMAGLRLELGAEWEPRPAEKPFRVDWSRLEPESDAEELAFSLRVTRTPLFIVFDGRSRIMDFVADTPVSLRLQGLARAAVSRYVPFRALFAPCLCVLPHRAGSSMGCRRRAPFLMHTLRVLRRTSDGPAERRVPRDF